MPAEFDPLNVEFARLLEKSGWKKSEAAAQHDLSPGVITRYLSGETRPSLVVIRLFKLLIHDREPIAGMGQAFVLKDESTALPMEDWEYDLLKYVRQIEGGKRVEVVKHLSGLLKLIGSGEESQVKYTKKKP